MADDTELTFEDLGHQGRPPDDTAPPCDICGVQDPWWRMRRSDTSEHTVQQLCFDCDAYLERRRLSRSALAEMGIGGAP